jgi:hypothetical protein
MDCNPSPDEDDLHDIRYFFIWHPSQPGQLAPRPGPSLGGADAAGRHLP